MRIVGLDVREVVLAIKLSSGRSAPNLGQTFLERILRANVQRLLFWNWGMVGGEGWEGGFGELVLGEQQLAVVGETGAGFGEAAFKYLEECFRSHLRSLYWIGSIYIGFFCWGLGLRGGRVY